MWGRAGVGLGGAGGLRRGSCLVVRAFLFLSIFILVFLSFEDGGLIVQFFAFLFIRQFPLFIQVSIWGGSSGSDS